MNQLARYEASRTYWPRISLSSILLDDCTAISVESSGRAQSRPHCGRLRAELSADVGAAVTHGGAGDFVVALLLGAQALQVAHPAGRAGGNGNRIRRHAVHDPRVPDAGYGLDLRGCRQGRRYPGPDPGTAARVSGCVGRSDQELVDHGQRRPQALALSLAAIRARLVGIRGIPAAPRTSRA